MLDPTATYRSSQVISASPAGQIVLLYQGAIRFAVQHVAFLERRDIEQAHRSSMRCQEIVAVLRELLDRSAGPIAVQLNDLYDFVLQRLIAGNMRKDPRPTEEAIQVLRGLLEAWQELALLPAPSVSSSPSGPAAAEAIRAPLGAASLVGAGLYAAGGRR